jgi:hypothetical protein
MIKLAYDFQEEIGRLKRDCYTAELDKYKYVEGSWRSHVTKLDDSDWNRIDIVSINDKKEVVGFFSAGLTRATKSTTLTMVRFGDRRLYMQDLITFIVFLYDKGFPAHTFTVIEGNVEAKRLHDGFVRKTKGKMRYVGYYAHGSFICGEIRKQHIYELIVDKPLRDEMEEYAMNLSNIPSIPK